MAMENYPDSSELLALSDASQMKIDRRLLGADRTPVLVVDNLFRDPERVRSFALSLHYDRPLPGDFWPGTQAAASLDRSGLDELIKEHLLRNELGLDTAASEFPVVRPGDTPGQWSGFFLYSRFGLLNMPPEQAPWVSQPHVDPFGLVATVIYLSDPPRCHGGTVICRHRETGLQCIPPHASGLPGPLIRHFRKSESFRIAAELLAKKRDPILDEAEPAAIVTERQHRLVRERLMTFAPTECGYMSRSTRDWEILDQVDMRFNRLVMYPTWLLHGVNWDMAHSGATKSEQRLTMMHWLNYPTPKTAGR